MLVLAKRDFSFERRHRTWVGLPPVILRRSRRCPSVGCCLRGSVAPFLWAVPASAERFAQEKKSHQLNSERGYEHGRRPHRQLTMKVRRRAEQRSLRGGLQSDFSACASLFNLLPFA